MLGGTAVSRTLSRAMLALAEGCGCVRQNLTQGIMSVFRGCVTEYPGIIVDHFIPSNCQRGRAFFLSHCHKDHMTGLDSHNLLLALSGKGLHLYCSEVTQGLISEDPEFVHIVPYLRSLSVEEPVNIKLNPLRDEKATHVTVTLLPAGHCPGSVMFLFQGDNGNVLYTGDFRLNLYETQKLRPLHHEGTDRVINLQTLYIDTTFCHDKARQIISREKTREIILEIAEKWLSQDSRNVLYLDCPSFGYEHIFLSVAKKLNSKVHISEWRMKSYSVLPDVHQCLTKNGEETRIHACGYRKNRKKGGLPCGCLEIKGETPNVLRVKPSTQWFVCSAGRINHSCVYYQSQNMFRVMHSMHSSYTELCDFISYLSPHSIVPCVIPFSLGDTSITDLHSRLRRLLPIRADVPQLNLSNNPDTDRSETVVVQRKDPGCEDEREEDEECSEYETDDEYIVNEDSETKSLLSHDSSFDKPFDLNLPAFSFPWCSSFSELKQPEIDLSFGDSPKSSLENSEGTDNVVCKSEGTPNAKRRKLTHDDNETTKKEEGQLNQMRRKGEEERQPDQLGRKKEEQQLDQMRIKDEEEQQPEQMRRKDEEEQQLEQMRRKDEEEQQPEQMRRKDDELIANALQPHENEDLNIQECVSVSDGESIIDLTQSSNDSNHNASNDKESTPDSVIFIGQSTPTRIIETKQVYMTSNTGTTTDAHTHQSNSPHKIVLKSSSHSPRDSSLPRSSCSPQSLGSPSFLPPTPGREKVESILDRRSFGFV